MPVTHQTPSNRGAGNSFLDGLIGIANLLRSSFSEPTIVCLGKHHHMFFVPFPFSGRLALTGIRFGLLWLLATSFSWAWNRAHSEEGSWWQMSLVPCTHPLCRHCPAGCHGLALSSELMSLEAALSRELWVNYVPLRPWGGATLTLAICCHVGALVQLSPSCIQ